MSETIVAIDLGSVYTKVVVASFEELRGKIKIAAVVETRTSGIAKGIITNMESATQTLRSALEQAKNFSGLDLSSANVVINISGNYTKSVVQDTYISIGDRCIGTDDIERAIETARHRAGIDKKNTQYRIIHALPIEFKIDEIDDIEDPLNMSASVLEVKVNIILADTSSIDNISRILASVGIKDYEIVSSIYASSIYALHDIDKKAGAIVLDIGAHTSDYAIYYKNALAFNGLFPVGSHHITNDLSETLHTPLECAESIKLEYKDLVSNETMIEVPKIGGDDEYVKVSMDVVDQIIKGRVEESFTVLAHLLREDAHYDKSGAGVIICGGMANFFNIALHAGTFFLGKTVRIVSPRASIFLGFEDFIAKPSSSCALGLCMYAAGHCSNYEISMDGRLRYKKSKDLEVKIKKSMYEEIVDIGAQVDKSLEEGPQIATTPAEHKKVFDGLKEEKKKNIFQRAWEWLKNYIITEL